MSSIVFDYAAIAASMKADKPENAVRCTTCQDTRLIDQALGGCATSGIVACPDCAWLEHLHEESDRA